MKTVTVAIPVYNNSQYTKQCIESIFENTEQDIKLLVIDNASSDNTLIVLNALKELKPSNILDFKIIENSENLGVVKSFNQAAQQFTTDLLLLLNNDCIVTKNWLEPLINLFNEEKTGIVSPLSNLFEGDDHPHPQLIKTEFENYEKIVENLASIKTQEISESKYVFGHCMLIARTVFDSITYFDERFGVGYFEEIDFCKRAREEGYKIFVSNRSYVHHFGNKTLDLMKIDRNNLLKENKRLFEEKWGESFEDQL